MPKLPVLMMDGEEFDPDPPSPKILELKKHLDKSERGHVFSLQKMLITTPFKDGLLRQFAQCGKYPEYCHRDGGGNASWVFGHPSGIKLYREWIAKKLAERAR